MTCPVWGSGEIAPFLDHRGDCSISRSPGGGAPKMDRRLGHRLEAVLSPWKTDLACGSSYRDSVGVSLNQVCMVPDPLCPCSMTRITNMPRPPNCFGPTNIALQATRQYQCKKPNSSTPKQLKMGSPTRHSPSTKWHGPFNFGSCPRN